MNRLIKVVLALVCVAAMGRYAYATDNDTEFGIEDDLTVLGTGGSLIDPDAEIKGFTVFGATQTSYPGSPIAGAGNVVVNGYLAVSSGAYFVGGSTFSTGGAYFTGISSFSSPSNIYVGGTGTLNQVLHKAADGSMVWGDDALGAGEITGTPRRLVMFQTDGGGGSDSLLQQDVNDLSITMVGTSSMTILGAFQANGAAKFNGAITLGDASGDAITAIGAVTAQNGVTVSGGGLSVSGGNASVTNNLTVNGNAQLGDDRLVDTHGVNQAPESGVALAVAGPDAGYAAKFYSGGSLAAWIKKK